MSRLEIVNNVTHQSLKVITAYSAELGDSLTTAPTFVTEFSEVQKEYPILFRKDADSGEYHSYAFFGFVKDENLFLGHGTYQVAPGWSANYIPAAVARGPFSIAYQQHQENGENIVSPMIQVDMEHPKVSSEAGENIFLAHGGNSAFLDNISACLNIIRDGLELNKSMFALFNKHNLLETVTIDIDLVNNEKHQISGFYTVNAEKLNVLAPDALKELAATGFLQAAYFAVASMSNLKKLINLKNRRLSEQKSSLS